MIWMKWDAEFTDNPQVVMTDWRGRVYFWQLCSICKKNRFNGIVPRDYATGLYIASKLPGIDPKEMDRGRTQCLNAYDSNGIPMIRETPEGIEIPGWKHWNIDPSNAKRQQEWRARQAEKRNAESNANPVTDDNVTVTGVTIESRDLRDKSKRSKNPPKPPREGGQKVNGKDRHPRKERHRQSQALVARGLTEDELHREYECFVEYGQVEQAHKLLTELSHSGIEWATNKLEELNRP